MLIHSNCYANKNELLANLGLIVLQFLLGKITNVRESRLLLRKTMFIDY